MTFPHSFASRPHSTEHPILATFGSAFVLQDCEYLDSRNRANLHLKKVAHELDLLVQPSRLPRYFAGNFIETLMAGLVQHRENFGLLYGLPFSSLIP